MAGSVRLGTAQGRWVLAATIAGSGMAFLDSTVVNVALARIGDEFDAGFVALQWITNAYTLTLAALRGHAIHLHAGIIGAVWCESPARDKAAFRKVQDAINAFPVTVTA